MTVRFYREKQRTVNDIFRTAIQPRAAIALQDIAQKVVYYAKTNHRYQNRTGALQESISWVPPVKVGDSYQTVIFAGGWSVAKYALDQGRLGRARRGTANMILAARSRRQYLNAIEGGKYRNIRYQRGTPFWVTKGQGLYVNYAPYVERKGFPVLSQAIAHYRPLVTRVLQQELKLQGVA